MVSRGSQGYDQTHGDLFFTTFTSEVATFGVREVERLVPDLVVKVKSDAVRVCAILTAIIGHVAKDRELRKKYVF